MTTDNNIDKYFKAIDILHEKVLNDKNISFETVQQKYKEGNTLVPINVFVNTYGLELAVKERYGKSLGEVFNIVIE